MTLKARYAVIGTNVHRALEVLRETLAAILAVEAGLVDVELALYLGEELVIGHLRVLLGSDDTRDVAAHFATSDGVAPSGVYAVAALDAIEEDGRAELSRQGCDGGAHIHRLAAIGAVALGSDGDIAALLHHLHTVEDGADVGGLLLDRNGLNEISYQRRDPAVRENVLGRHVIDRLAEGHSHEELVKGRLMIVENEIWSLDVGFELV